MTTEEIISHLNDLIAVCRDGERGYHTAAADIHNSQLQTVFDEYAKQRAQFARALQQEVSRLGGSPADTGSLSAAVHRGWMDMKAALTGSDSAAIVGACETGEDSAAAAYERVVNAGLTGETRSVVEGQWHKIKEAHSRMARLKNETT